jgi:hypothetical protein
LHNSVSEFESIGAVESSMESILLLGDNWESVPMSSERFVNLTPHEVNIGNLDVPPSGTVARVEVAHQVVAHHAGVPLLVGDYGAISNLPVPQTGVLYIVSAAVRSALPHRLDLASPAHLVRDNEGRIIGCLALEINSMIGN